MSKTPRQRSGGKPGSKDLHGTVAGALAKHEAWRSETLNLIASENALSPAVRSALNNDLLQRYADYPGRDANARRYRGNRFIAEIERETADLAKEVLRAQWVELRPLAGHLAGLAVILGVCRPHDVVLELGREGGGHREAGRFTASQLVQIEVMNLPFDAENYNVDLPAAVKLIEDVRPRLVILGSSNFLFPHPVEGIAAALHRSPGAVLAYDASHVMGFLAAASFQDPLREGADIVFGSTHKTFPGPQGGIILSDREDLIDAASKALVPALVTNHHPFRMPALALALMEMRTWGRAYVEQIVKNSEALGTALDSRGIPVVCVEGRYSASHTLLLKVSAFGKAEDVALRLEAAGIITTGTLLPDALGIDGIRIGTQEITRLGAMHPDMLQVADLISQAIHGSSPVGRISRAVRQFATSLGPVRFTWGDPQS